MKMDERTKRPERGERYTLLCDNIGEKGDGIFHVERFVLIVPGTKPGRWYEVEVTNVRERVAFGEVLREVQHG